MTTKKKSTKKPSKPATSAKSSKKAKSAPRRSLASAYSIATGSKNTVRQRVSAIAELPRAVCDSDDKMHSMLNILRNRSEPLKVRLAALQTLQAATFSVIAFESCRGDYTAALREVAEDPEPEIRQRALGILSRDKDGFAQKKLLDGLQNPENALVPPEKALQLLSYDVHGEAYTVAREIVSKPPNPEAKREALRLLAADSKSAPMFEKILRDKDELAENRQISASALQALKPEKLQQYAREMLLDKSEYKEIQATSMTALTQFGDDKSVSEDKELLEGVDRLRAKAPGQIKQSAKRFLSKYKR